MVPRGWTIATAASNPAADPGVDDQRPLLPQLLRHNLRRHPGSLAEA
jgi:hypothetical protein